MPSKNEIAATMSRGQAAQLGVIGFENTDQASHMVAANSRKLFGFTRKLLPEGLPTEPKLYIFSISEYGEMVDLGPGFQKFTVHPCPEGEQYGEPCVILPLNFFEEAKVDVTEHTFTSGKQIADAILKIGPGMQAGWDRRKLGWFISDTEIPTEEEVARAVAIFTQECTRLLAEGNRYSSANQLNEINETHRRAAKYLRQKVDWDKPMHKMVDCAACGEAIKAGSVIHAVSYCGAVQLGRWPDAINMGIKRLKDAPDDVQRAFAAEEARDKRRKENQEKDLTGN